MKRKSLILVVAFVLATVNQAWSDTKTDVVFSNPPLPDARNQNHSVKPATVDCVISAAEKYRVPANILLAIASVERGKNGQSVKNTNGSADLGHFQINTIHWNKNGGIFYKTRITKDDVLWRGCYAAELAAWMIESYMLADNKDYWAAISRYHSSTPKYNKIYKEKVVDYAVEWGDWLQRRYSQDKISVRYKPTTL